MSSALSALAPLPNQYSLDPVKSKLYHQKSKQCLLIWKCHALLRDGFETLCVPLSYSMGNSYLLSVIPFKAWCVVCMRFQREILLYPKIAFFLIACEWLKHMCNFWLFFTANFKSSSILGVGFLRIFFFLIKPVQAKNLSYNRCREFQTVSGSHCAGYFTCIELWMVSALKSLRA